MLTLVGKCIIVCSFSALKRRISYRFFNFQNAIVTKSRDGKKNPREHWLDYATPKYGKRMVNDTKALLRILVLYIPLPIFWALFEQQGSRWTEQAKLMNGDTPFNYTIKPEQMQVLNPLFILLFIPLYDTVLYPILSKIGINRPLQKITAGGMMAGVAFLISGFLELELEKTYPVLPTPDNFQVRFYNGAPCNYSTYTSIPDYTHFNLSAMGYYEIKNIDITKEHSLFKIELIVNETNARCLDQFEMPLNGKLLAGKALGVFVKSNGVEFDHEQLVKKEKPMVRFLSNMIGSFNLLVESSTTNRTVYATTNETDSSLLRDYLADDYSVFLNGVHVISLELRRGGVTTVLLSENEADPKYSAVAYDLTKSNSVSILWMIPQYVVLTLAEVMFSVTGLEFSYAQAPNSMKSVLQACWQLTVAIGNTIVIIIVGAKLFTSQANEFFLFAILIFVDMLVFIGLAANYRPSVFNDDDDEDDYQLENASKPSPLEDPAAFVEPQVTMPSQVQKLKRSNEPTSPQTFENESNDTNGTDKRL